MERVLQFGVMIAKFTQIEPKFQNYLKRFLKNHKSLLVTQDIEVSMLNFTKKNALFDLEEQCSLVKSLFWISLTIVNFLHSNI
jgi:hypothetical protein